MSDPLPTGKEERVATVAWLRRRSAESALGGHFSRKEGGLHFIVDPDGFDYCADVISRGEHLNLENRPSPRNHYQDGVVDALRSLRIKAEMMSPGHPITAVIRERYEEAVASCRPESDRAEEHRP